jgi:hypothetical protein
MERWVRRRIGSRRTAAVVVTSIGLAALATLVAGQLLLSGPPPSESPRRATGVAAATPTSTSVHARLTPDGVIAALRTDLDPADTAGSPRLITLCDLTTVTGTPGPSGNCADVLWYVAIDGPAPQFPPMAWGAGDSGWLVLDDATGKVMGAGGWGFVPASPGSFPSTPRSWLQGGIFALSTDSWLSGTLCAGIGLDAVLLGSPTDPYVAWLVSQSAGAPRTDVIWPAGYRARFAPDLEVLDEAGNVVLREGDPVGGACVHNSGWYLQPPFR